MSFKTNCLDCGEEFSLKRKELGYQHCLKCGDQYALKETVRKSMCIAPAYNKGAYMYITNRKMAKEVGK